ncbi:amidohydrolase family protein [Mangrovibrevibacter kandeliae]|uniref:amidohydrolase family protein n=1 Tax=Mangrovibrevibacter kandeliae TaxID=2968473 RepID=UPI00211914DF|nr:amidohydrolase family protein [Aurantimonas sp. CSK15Z-1]MCQ8783091.1 amidohydrolase family protein [Aurantimonas sp. CSK15Z-1]
MTTLIKADRLIDGTGKAPLKDAVLLVEGGIVKGVFEGQAPKELVPADAEVLDFPGCTILPGLIDTHVHLNLPGDGSTLEDAMRETEGVFVATSSFAASKALDAGITSVRDVGGSGRTVIDVRRTLELGYGRGARICACGQPITVTGGHTWYWGGEADGEERLRLKVREMVRLGADFIKVMASGGGTVNTISWLPAFSQRELSAIADEAHRMDRKITAHCLCAASIEYAIEAGVDQIEHAGFIVNAKGEQIFDAAVAEKLGKAGIPVTGTLAVGGYMVEAMQAKTDRTPAEQSILDRWLRMLDDNLDQFAQLRQAGVEFVAGTDAGWRFTPVDALPTEIALMQRGGMTAMEAIVAATGFAARTIGIEDRAGTLAPGLASDVLVVAGNPLDDLKALRDVRMVMQGTDMRITPSARA